MPARRTVVFVHGCFFHAHNCKRGRREPKTNATYWRKKRETNAARDAAAAVRLAALGWRVVTVWECETADAEALSRRLLREVDTPRHNRG